MLDETLQILGYRPEDDSWDTDGRLTFSHDDNATRAYLTTLRGILGRQGWYRDPAALRTFLHDSGRVIEIEPGGSDCDGHYLHIIKMGRA